jgi:hypothetical protein
MSVEHFVGLMPESMQEGHRTGVELDSITARIAGRLYPDFKIFAKGFEETPVPDNYFSGIVGNVPFGDYGVHDLAMKRQFTRAIHDYFPHTPSQANRITVPRHPASSRNFW